MKKVIFISLLIFFLAGNAFAQVSFSGEVNTGVQLLRDFNYNEAISVHQPEFNLTATVSRPLFGARLDVSFLPINPDSPVDLNGMYGWVNFLDNAIRVSFGHINNAVWIANLDADHQFKFDDIDGFRIEYRTPISGLSVGAAFPVYNPRTNEPFDIYSFKRSIILGGSFFHPMFNTVIAYDMGNDARLLFGFNYTGIHDLTAGIQVMVVNLAKWDHTVRGHWGRIITNQKVGYRVIRPLTVSLLTGQTIHQNANTDIELRFMPGVSYRILPNLTASLDVKVETIDLFTNQDIFVRPSMELTLGAPAVFFAEYELKLSRYRGDSFHRFAVGLNIRTF